MPLAGASFIESSALFHSLPRASFGHVVPATTLRVRADDLWVFPGRPIAIRLASDAVTVIPNRRTPRTRRRMPVILCKRAVLNGPSRDALQPKSDWPRLIHAFSDKVSWVYA